MAFSWGVIWHCAFITALSWRAMALCAHYGCHCFATVHSLWHLADVLWQCARITAFSWRFIDIVRSLRHLVDVLLPLCAHYGINLTFYGTVCSLWHLADVCEWNTGLFGVLSIASTETGYHQVSCIHIATAARAHTQAHHTSTTHVHKYTRRHITQGE